MKQWFRHEFGYANLDNENIYLTNSGNWSEVHELKEKTRQSIRKDDNRSSLIIGFLIIVVILFCVLIYKGVINGKSGSALIFVVAAMGYKAYSYLKTEIGIRYKIPFEKIDSISVDDKTLTIKFTNGENHPDECQLYKIEEKAIKIVSGLDQYVA